MYIIHAPRPVSINIASNLSRLFAAYRPLPLRATLQPLGRAGGAYRGRLGEIEAVQPPVDIGQSVGSASGVRGNSWAGVCGSAGRVGIGAG